MKTAKPAGGVPLPIVARMMNACAGLHAAHELRDAKGQQMGLVHRDVSPQNILVTYDGTRGSSVALATQKLPAQGRPATKLGVFGTSVMAGLCGHTGTPTELAPCATPSSWISTASPNRRERSPGRRACLHTTRCGRRTCGVMRTSPNVAERLEFGGGVASVEVCPPRLRARFWGDARSRRAGRARRVRRHRARSALRRAV